MQLISKVIYLRASRWIPCELKSSRCSEAFFQAFWYSHYKCQFRDYFLQSTTTKDAGLKKEKSKKTLQNPINNFDLFKGLISCQGPWFTNTNIFAFDVLLPRDHKILPMFLEGWQRFLKNAYDSPEFKSGVSNTKVVFGYTSCSTASSWSSSDL